ncbi:protein-disulfide reductase DsbD [Marinomonas transparens]|uniref:Protein-disulfide reductase DsbD n=1 Tax=Marinomonas transparens TaxID=2795388 RepID=A0A934JMV0_9GAMM|nr:protein-disulfide reductase DsbD [Marinomonas transparens]MBJ7539130.1 protein-disulfide reductase DsbD [Marinomonas transparens]
MRLTVLLLLFFIQHAAYAFTFAPASSFDTPEFLSADQAFQLSVSSPQEGKITAKWLISEGYYLYQKQFSLSGEQANKLHFAPFPSGETNTDEYYGQVTVYRHQLSLAIYYDINLPAGTKINAILSYQGCADKGLCYPPQKSPIQFTVPPPPASTTIPAEKAIENNATGFKLSPSEASHVSQLLSSANLWTSLATIFGLGLLLSFTPCVLPMVPIVSAIVVGTRDSKLGSFYYSLIYVLGMAFTYAAIGALVGTFGSQLNLQAQLQNPILLVISAALFVALALAMFGVYELHLPSAWQSRLQASANISSSPWKSSLSTFLAGVFSTLVVSPCISAPLAGILLYISSQGHAGYGALMLFIMALGMGIPLLMVGLFGPRILPKNGEWLTDIKTLMGFGLLGVAIWLITRWLPASSHLFLWGGLAFAISGYFIHRAYSCSSHPVRWFLALACFAIGIIEFAGAAAGGTKPLVPLSKLFSSANSTQQNLFNANITSLDELQALIDQADTRPIVLDLYADWCISCKILEDEVFRAPDVSPLLNQVRLVRVDVTKNSADNQAFMAKFNLFGPPSLVFLDPQGKERKELTLIGEPNKNQVINRLKLIGEP